MAISGKISDTTLYPGDIREKPRIYTAYGVHYVNDLEAKRDGEQCWDSPTFSCSEDPLETKWFVSLKFGGKIKGYLSLNVKHLSTSDILTRRITVVIYDGNDVELRRETFGQSRMMSRAGGSGLTKFFRLELLPTTRRKVGDSEAQLLVEVRVSFEGMGIHLPVLKLQEFDPDLPNDYATLLESGEGSDVTLVVRGAKHRVNKALLGARSGYFRNMFAPGTKESKDKEIAIEGVGSELFKQLLDYLYGGRLPQNFSQVVYKMLPLADKYEVNGLKKACETQWIKNLTKDNVCRSATYAYKFGCAALKAACIGFIKTYPEDVKRGEGWDEMKKWPGLAEEFLDFL